MKTRLLILTLAVCTIAAPAQADLFRFSFDDLQTTYTGATKTFTADKTQYDASDPLNVIPGTIGSVTRYPAPSGKAIFDWVNNVNLADGRGNLATNGDFQLSMNLTNITATTADGTGWFKIWDVTDNQTVANPSGLPADTIFGNIAGVWTQSSQGALTFDGVLSGVGYTDPTPGWFNGHSGFIDYAVPGSPPPWAGTIVQITATAPWFTLADFDVIGGSLDATIVPVPGAVLLGILGMSVAGLKLRKHA
jgi:hypothetical protein